MSEVTKPIALDESLHTTEQAPRNLADVLANGLANIANNVKPDGSDISIDVPGMDADNVNDGFSELKQSLDTSTNTSVIGLTCEKSANVVSITFGNLTLATGETKIMSQVIPSGYRPSSYRFFIGKVFNSSAYVDCRILIRNDGMLIIDDLSANAISGIQPQYINPKTVTYIVN